MVIIEMNIDHPSSWDALPDKYVELNKNIFRMQTLKGRRGVCAVALEYAQVTSRVFKVRTMVFECVPRISGTRHGLRCSRVRVIV